MKDYYEDRYRLYLTRRTPAIIRVDGRAFHSFTKGMKRPYDEILTKAMWETARYLCKNIMGAKIAYTQSDEISVLMLDYSSKLTTEAWLDYNIQKIASLAASMATMRFNDVFADEAINFLTYLKKEYGKDDDRWLKIYGLKLRKAMFDARVFNIPESEVVNYFIWRQQDAIRNSVEMLGRTHMPHKDMQGLNTAMVKSRLRDEYDIRWEEQPVFFQRGACIIRTKEEKEDINLKTGEKETALHRTWKVDKDIPVFTQNRSYIEDLLKIEKQE